MMKKGGDMISFVWAFWGWEQIICLVLGRYTWRDRGALFFAHSVYQQSTALIKQGSAIEVSWIGHGQKKENKQQCLGSGGNTFGAHARTA